MRIAVCDDNPKELERIRGVSAVYRGMTLYAVILIRLPLLWRY